MISIKENIASPYYGVFNNEEHSDIVITTGRAGGKSSGMLGIKAIFTAINEPCAQIVMRKFHNKLNKTVYQECKRAIYRLGLSATKDFKCRENPMRIQYLKNGSTIYFSGNDNIDDTKGIIDPMYPIQRVYIDELTEFFERGDGEDELEQIKATFVRGNEGLFQTIYLFNPPKNPKAPIMEWLSNMKKRSNFKHVHTDYRFLPEEWLGKALIEQAEIMKEYDEKMYRWVWLGECIGLDDVIYYMFDESKHVKTHSQSELKQLRYVGIGIDYGQLNATTYQAFGIDFRNKLIRGIDEYYHSGRGSGKQRTPSEYAQDFKQFVVDVEKATGQKVSYAVIDPSAKGLAEEIKRICPFVKIIYADNAVMTGINRVQKLMSFERIVYSSHQKHLIEEKYLYEWDKKSIERGQEKPIKDYDHCLDAERYYVMYVWKYIGKMLPFLLDKGVKE